MQEVKPKNNKIENLVFSIRCRIDQIQIKCDVKSWSALNYGKVMSSLNMRNFYWLIVIHSPFR